MPSQLTTPTNFNLLHEIGKGGNYMLLYPGPQAGLAILALYLKIKTGAFINNRFKESDIYNAFEASKMLIGEEEYERLPQAKFNNMISDLQVYFLRYDADEQVYSLKDYADAFCRQAEETLLANFNPTKIELICNDLRAKLEQCATDKDIDTWIVTYFDTVKPVLKVQVDQLERQVDQSVKEIRATTQLENASILETLKEIDLKLDTTREHNEELRSAFREMKFINRLLDSYSQRIDNPLLFQKISVVKQFFPELKYTLNLIDKRLDRIQPKLRQFFSMLNKPTFSVRAEKFLKFLLRHATVENNRPVALPLGIPLYSFAAYKASLTIVERRNLLPPASKPRITYETDFAEREKGTARAREQLSILDETQRYLDIILAEAAMAPVLFSSWFFKIVSSKNGDIETATHVAYALIKHSQRNQHLKIEKGTIKKLNPDYPTLSIWEMTIQQMAR
jgi:hypothetical protein